jgi:hypothetical protein
MVRCLPAAVAVALLLGPLPAVTLAAEEPRPTPAQLEFFEKSIRPLLVSNCFECHGSRKQKGGLRLDSRDAILKGSDNGPVVVAGKPDQSLLITAINHPDNQPAPLMPPKGKLKAEEIRVLSEWVKQGLPWPPTNTQVRPIPVGKDFKITDKDREFWSFRPIADPAAPQVRDTAWPKTSIDPFILARLEASGLRPAAPADRRTLLRRVTFDLIGLPPTPEEIDAFLADSSPDAFAKVVERLLASPHYGERWARHWLDVARYGEDQAHTFQARLYPQGYRYRDWLVKAFNDDMPYHRFVKEQIAADLLDEPNRRDNLPALGFFALGPVYYGDPKKLDQLDDRLDTLCRGFLGLTVACARCHDHKFDPIPTRDYYSLAGIFASTDYVEAPLVSAAEVEEAKKKLPEEQKKKKVPPQYPFAHALKESRPANMRVLVRGNPDNQAEEAPRRFLAILGGGQPFASGSGRLELAQCVASQDNPLTARVLVNRIWQHHFGKGLVRTPSNFGALGERPTHPELLDHLATHFMAAGWSIKALHRTIVLSAAYQQSSRLDAHAFEVDPDNKLLWRMNRRRLEVESWRDAMLAAADNLDRSLGGPSRDLNAPDNRRRTLYGYVSRHELNALLRLFDFPDPNLTAGERTVTTVPLQQLFVLNSEFMVQNARALVKRLSSAKDDAVRIRHAYLLLYGRPATDRELELGLAFVAKPATGLTRWEQYAQVLLSASEFLFVD